MFKMFGKKKEIEQDNQVYAPVNGEVIDLADVEDPVFSKKIMGDGFGVIPKDGSIVSPVTGEVTMIADTKHAIGLKVSSGLDVLLHLGIDTVELKEAPFILEVKQGDILQGGSRIGTMDSAAIEAAGKKTTVIVVVTNAQENLKAVNVTKGESTLGQVIGKLETN